MAICTSCGKVFHDDDAPNHKCDVNDLPKKGEKSVNQKKLDSVIKREKIAPH